MPHLAPSSTVIDLRIGHELPQFEIFGYILSPEQQPICQITCWHWLIQVPNQALPHDQVNPIITHNLIRAQPPPVVQQNRGHAAHLPKLDVAHPRFLQDFPTELGGSVE